MDKLFVAVDIGCIECGEESAVLGVFTTEEKAEAVLNDHRIRQNKNWRGQHSFECFEVDGIDVIHKKKYRKGGAVLGKSL